jgi:hypothetical protein
MSLIIPKYIPKDNLFMLNGVDLGDIPIHLIGVVRKGDEHKNEIPFYYIKSTEPDVYSELQLCPSRILIKYNACFPTHYEIAKNYFDLCTLFDLQGFKRTDKYRIMSNSFPHLHEADFLHYPKNLSEIIDYAMEGMDSVFDHEWMICEYHDDINNRLVFADLLYRRYIEFYYRTSTAIATREWYTRRVEVAIRNLQEAK